MTSIKEMALDFLDLIIHGNPRKAFELYAGKGFKHHNAHFKGDAESLITAMEEDWKQNPEKIFEVKRTLQEGDLVAIHSGVRQHPEDPGAVIVHIFRFNSGRIVELWDIVQPAPPETINEHGMF